MNVLVSKMSPELSMETNLSAQITICELIEERENRELFGIVTSEENMGKIKEYAMSSTASAY